MLDWSFRIFQNNFILHHSSLSNDIISWSDGGGISSSNSFLSTHFQTKDLRLYFLGIKFILSEYRGYLLISKKGLDFLLDAGKLEAKHSSTPMLLNQKAMKVEIHLKILRNIEKLIRKLHNRPGIVYLARVNQCQLLLFITPSNIFCIIWMDQTSSWIASIALEKWVYADKVFPGPRLGKFLI